MATPPASRSSVPPPERRGRGFPPALRVLRRDDFLRVMQSGVRFSDGRILLRATASGVEWTRLGLVVSRRYGNAPRRNRFKRRMREAFRLHYEKLPPGLDLVCAPAGTADILLAEAVESLLRLAERAARRLAAR